MADCLWTPSPERVKQTNMYRFMQVVNDTYGQQFSDYDGLYQWSINNIGEFWATLWEFAAIKASRPFDQVVDGGHQNQGSPHIIQSETDIDKIRATHVEWSPTNETDWSAAEY